MDLNKEAEEYKKSTVNKMSIEKTAFIAGANSKYVQAKILQAQIDVLKEIDEQKTTGPEHNAFYDLIDMKNNKIHHLEQQLKQLENG